MVAGMLSSDFLVFFSLRVGVSPESSVWPFSSLGEETQKAITRLKGFRSH